MMNFKNLFLKILFLFPLFSCAQTSLQLSASEIKLALEKLNTVGSVLYIAAHPDDENTRLLSYLVNERKVRTGYLSLTRGDGGQNLIGDEQGELLGVIRTQELLAARRTDGAEQFFTRAVDFGFSKNPEEALAIWGKDKILADVVWVIRNFRPDVIITRFPEDSRAGHGHHTASAILAHEAFLAAADPQKFPEQLKTVQPWQAKRLLWNTYSFGSINTTSENQMKLDVGLFNPLLGKGYGEIAAESRSKHKSQGFGSASTHGQQWEYFEHIAGPPAKTDLFDGIDLSWNRIAGGEQIGRLITTINKNFNPTKPSESVKDLIGLLRQIRKLPPAYWRIQKEKEVQQLIAACAGLWFESNTARTFYTPGDSVAISHQILNRSVLPVQLKSVAVGERRVPINQPLARGIIKRVHSSAIVSKLTQPYWLAEKHGEGIFTVNQQELIGKPENGPALKAGYTFEIEGETLTMEKPVSYKFTDPVQGEIHQPLVVAPPVTATLDEKAYIFINNQSQEVPVKLKNFGKAGRVVLQITVPPGWQAAPREVPLEFTKQGEEQSITLKITPGNQPEPGAIKLSVLADKKNYPYALKIIRYGHIPQQALFPAAEASIAHIHLKTQAKTIGYLVGAGDMVPEALRQIGYQVNLLNESDIQTGNLSAYDAIVTGIRFYNVNDRARFLQPRLMEYIKNGGTLVVQYNTTADLKIQEIGPYPFRISRNRVTDETAQVSFVNPRQDILRYPNFITSADFDGWVQERGLYFLSEIDSHYQTVLKMNDKGEQQDDGSLLVANYGKGKFVYTSLSFFRQLPAGVPGAYRLFVNLIEKNNEHGKSNSKH